LKNAWISGAWAWTTSKRESYANDLSDPQLIAVTDNVNQSKSDKSGRPSRLARRPRQRCRRVVAAIGGAARCAPNPGWAASQRA